MQMYHLFSHILKIWSTSPGTAILCGDDHKSISYSKLADMIRNAEIEIRLSGIRSELIVTDHEPATLIRIFACVISGCDVILIDENTPDETAPRWYQAGDENTHEGRLIFFTSGTTGSSRAVVLTSESLLCSSFSGQAMLPCGPGDIILSLLPFSHVFGFVCTMLWGLTYGATIALGRGTRYLLSDCEFFKPTILPVVPSLLKMLMQQHVLPASLKVLLVGAAPLDAVSVKALQNVGMKVYLGYGLTETSSGIAITQDQKDPFALYPCPGADIRIEPDGEISVATPCMMQGYLDFSETVREDAGSDEAENNDNSAYVLGHPIIPVEGGRLYTGDLGSLDTRGALCLTGRKKDMLVLPDGTKIFCPEYEEELSGLIGLSDLTVILKQDRPFLVIGDSGGNVPENIDSLLAEFNEKRAMGLRICGVLSYGKPLPRTATGKIRRWEIEK